MSAPRWSPDVTIDTALATRTIRAQFPELAAAQVRPLGAGWDNAVFVVGGVWAFRFVHRATALDGAVHERAVLGALPADLPLAVPRPRFIGHPTAEVPWPFWGGPLIPGTGLAEAGLPDDRRTALGSAVGAFLRRLHRPENVPLGTDASRRAGTRLWTDPWQRTDPSVIAPRARATVDRLTTAGALAPDDDVTAVLTEGARLGPATGEPVLSHGDLHGRHVLVDADGSATGVIDWGDVCLADPSADLMFGYLALAGRAREAFQDAYGPVSAERELRARVLAVHVGAALAEQAVSDGMTAVATEAIRGLSRAAG